MGGVRKAVSGVRETHLVASSSVALVETRRATHSIAESIQTLSVLLHLPKLHVQRLWNTAPDNNHIAAKPQSLCGSYFSSG